MLAQAHVGEFDTGPKSGGPGAERLCAVTREVKPVSEMIRFVLGPGGEVVPDVKRRLPGRGIWITACRATLKEAIRRGVFGRGLGPPVKTPPDLAGMTERLLERSALDALAMAGKAGRAVTGFTKVEAALERDPVIVVLHASDAAPDGVRKLGAALRRRAEAEGRAIATVAIFGSAQLGLAFGRSDVVHAALLAGPASQSFLTRYAQLHGFRAGEMGRQTRKTDA